MWQIHRAREILQEQGLIELCRQFSDYVINQTPFLSRNRYPYYKRRVDNKYRWAFMQEYIKDLNSCLDIGCAQGYFTAKAADEGLLTLGIDNDPERLSTAYSEWGFKPNLGFAHWKITPSNIEDIPTADVILLLTVYHHFVKFFGVYKARLMLGTLGKKTDLLICEMPGDRLTGLSFKYHCTNIETGETHEVTDYQDSDGMWSENTGCIRPKLSKYLPPGDYEITVHADGYDSSEPFNITILQSRRLREERPRIRIEKNSIKVIPGSQEEISDIDDVIVWYKNILRDIFGDSVKIVDTTISDRKGEQTKRKEILYIVDTSDV